MTQRVVNLSFTPELLGPTADRPAYYGPMANTPGGYLSPTVIDHHYTITQFGAAGPGSPNFIGLTIDSTFAGGERAGRQLPYAVASIDVSMLGRSFTLAWDAVLERYSAIESGIRAAIEAELGNMLPVTLSYDDNKVIAPPYVPTGPNVKSNGYYAKKNHTKLAKIDSNKTEFLGTVGGA